MSREENHPLLSKRMLTKISLITLFSIVLAKREPTYREPASFRRRKETRLGFREETTSDANPSARRSPFPLTRKINPHSPHYMLLPISYFCVRQITFQPNSHKTIHTSHSVVAPPNRHLNTRHFE